MTPIIVRDADALAREAIGAPGTYNRHEAIERVSALIMRVDVAAREQALADRGARSAEAFVDSPTHGWTLPERG